MNLGKLTEQKVVCPHCWHGFYSDQAMFISRHAELYGDPVLGPGENQRFSPQDCQRDREGKMLDPKGWSMVERACPVCHLQVPQDLLTKRPCFVSVVGAPSSGKTYFLTAMVHTLRNELARYFGFALHDCDSHEVKAFLEYERTLFFSGDPSKLTFLKKTTEQGELYNRVTLDGVQILLPKPFIFSLRPTEANIDAAKYGGQLRQNLVLYDNAGESFDSLKEKDGSNRVTQHLAECDAVLFTVDPLLEPDARNRLASVSTDPQLTTCARNFRQETVLAEVANRIRRHRRLPSEQRIDTPLAIAVQKYDVWKPLLSHLSEAPGLQSNGLIDHTSIHFVANKGIAGLDIQEINANSLLVRGFLQDLCPQLVALAEANFKVVRYFPVSALGTSPEYDDSVSAKTPSELVKVRPSNVHPFRVTDPMLWLLGRWRFIRHWKDEKEDVQAYPTALVKSVTGDQIRIFSPEGAGLLILDREYAGSVIIDPTSGKKVWIPPVAPAAPPPVTAPPAASAPGGGLELRLPEAAKPIRRGWFKK